MRFPVKIKGIKLPSEELGSSLRAVQDALTKHVTLFGEFRLDTDSVIAGYDFAPIDAIDFSVTNVSIDDEYLVYDVNLLNEKITLKPEELLVIPGYYKRDNLNKQLARLTLVPNKQG